MALGTKLWTTNFNSDLKKYYCNMMQVVHLEDNSFPMSAHREALIPHLRAGLGLVQSKSSCGARSEVHNNG